MNGFINVVDISDESGKVTAFEQIKVALWDNLIYAVSVDGAFSDSSVIKRIKSEISQANISENDVIRIELTGEYDCYYSPDLNYILR